MFDRLINILKEHGPGWEKYRHLFREIGVPAHTVILREGETSREFILLKKVV